ncbi:DNA-primase RepB domain-containing protein [Archangium lansingense]|uniref:DNA-primase RepB domain-containing protein n=1 Tax=Archangium lansingense TaxID=2995310 RepID=UPI003B7840DB
MSPVPNRDMALAFIASLTGSPNTEVLWQLVADSATAPAARNATHWWALTDKAWSWLSEENARFGLGVFLQVNEGNSERRLTENVVALRALFIDDDKGLLPPDSLRLAALPPTLTVRTRKGWHHYWILAPGEELSAFKSAQATLAAHFGTDPAVKDLPRVMRVPGFLHMKDPANPVLVQLVRAGGERYSIADVLNEYPAPEGFQPPAPSAMAVGLKPKRRRKQGEHTATTSRAEGQALLVEMLRHPLIRWMREEPDDVDRETWRGVGQNLACAVQDHPDLLERARQEFHKLSVDYSGYSWPEAERTFQSALDSVLTVGPMTFAHMVASGMPKEHWSAGATSLIHAARLSLRARQGGV